MIQTFRRRSHSEETNTRDISLVRIIHSEDAAIESNSRVEERVFVGCTQTNKASHDQRASLLEPRGDTGVSAPAIQHFYNVDVA